MKLPMSIPEYQRLAARMDERYAPSIPWDELPAVPQRGRPPQGQERTPLSVHSFKLTDEEWQALTAAAKAHGMSATALVRRLIRPDIIRHAVG